jgi:hypothetical protein
MAWSASAQRQAVNVLSRPAIGAMSNDIHFLCNE